jgi:hypothetical protein
MIVKKKPSLLSIGILVFMLINTGLLTGCTSNISNTSPPSVVSFPVLSSIDYTILNQAYTDYEQLRESLSPIEARQQLLEKLNNKTNGVEHAQLGVDGYTIFVTYSDDDFAGIDTFELDEEAQQQIGFSGLGYSGFSEDDYLSEHTLRFDAPPIQTTRYPSKAYDGETDYNILIVGSEGKTTCESKKVLILGPCYWEFPKQPTDTCINFFKQHGWTDEDLTVKLVTIDPYYNNTDCLTLIPNDYFNLEEYGIILFVGHGLGKALDSCNETSLYLQFCYLNNASFVNNPSLQQWKDQRKLLILDAYKIGRGNSSQYIYGTAIRADLLRSQIKGTLPSSFVYLATCFGGFFNKMFLDKGAKIVLGWDNLVKANYADGNMENMVKIMLQNQSCVYSTYADHSIVKGYCSWDPETPIRGLIPSYNDEPKKTTPNVNFHIYPDPSIDSISFSFYFPTWIDLQITGIPEGTSRLQMSVYDSNGTLLIQGEKTVGTEETEVDIHYMANVCFPPKEKYTLKITTFDSSSEELTTLESAVTLNTGRNTLQKQLQQSGGLTIEFKDSAQKGLLDAKRVIQSLSIDAKLQKKSNGDVLYVWDSSGDSSLGGFGYFKQQHLEMTNIDNAYFISNGTGEDGTMIPITCSAYLIREDGTQQLIGSASAEIEVYNPSQSYELCSNPEGTEGLRLGSGSSWSFYIVDHGPLYGNEFFARTGDQLRAYCDYAGYMAEGLTYDIYIRIGALEDPPAETQLIISQSEIQDGLNKIVTITI